MDFLGIGPWEILLILIIALIILGPGKLPEIARTMGKTVRAIKKASADLTTAVTRELEVTQNAPPPEEAKAKTMTPAVNKAEALSQDSQPTNPGETSAVK